ncbi:hypothetical protein NNO_1163 [Hydrogenimonas sp.]|nr:hypothetical protein NNO_1163 [Hydrogenimonas sp.]
MTYRKAVSVRRVGISYSPWKLLSPKPTIEKITLAGARVYPDRFKKEKKEERGGSIAVFPPIYITNLSIEDAKLMLSPVIGVEADAKSIKIARDGLDIGKITASADSKYGSVKLHGSFEDMELNAVGTVTPSKFYRDETARQVEGVPRSLPLKLHTDFKTVKVSTSISHELKIRDTNISISGIEADAEYLLKDRYFKTRASYALHSPQIDAAVQQSALVTLFGAYATKADVKIVKSEHALPFKEFRIDAAGDETILLADLYADPFRVNLYSSDYRNFALHAVAKPHRPDYIEHLPAIFTAQCIGMEADATAHLTPEPGIEGVLSLDGNYTFAKSYIELNKESLLVRSTVMPKEKEGGIWAELPNPMRTEIDAFVYVSEEKKIVSVISEKADLTLFEQKGSINGWADIGSLTLDAQGSVKPDSTVDIAFDAHIDSLRSLLYDLNITERSMIDAEIKSRFNLKLADTFSLSYRSEIPWYIVEPDSQHVYYGLNSTLEGTLKNNRITIDRYSIAFKGRRFTQKRASILSLDENMTLQVEKLSLLDTLTAKGFYSFKTKKGRFSLKGRNSHYSGPEGKVTADADITAEISPEELGAEGEIFIKEALITYRPQKEYVVEDEDIVIIQDIEEPSRTQRKLNIHIYSDAPLRYKIPEVEAEFIPDITIWKEAGKPFSILGIVKITEGSVNAADKRFTIEPSNIYFSGANPINPYLDLHFLYELDFYKFNIYVGHTLAKPLFLFSSEPPMSQNDIMSYILFGAPADEAFKASGEPSGSIAAMLLGLGLKNAIGSATGIRFDTLSILSSENGGFGIEVGKRIGKRLRIIYRNDTVSSFIIQYRASRSIRIDVDVRDTGQGISILYVKDFSGTGL